MEEIELTSITRANSKVLWTSACLAFVLEFSVLTYMGWRQHWLAHPQKTTGLDASKFIEAEVFQPPPEAHLSAPPSSTVAVPHAPEAVLSKVAGQGKKAKPEDQRAAANEQNQTTTEVTHMAPTHGPVAVYSPPPEIPSYLQNQDLKASAVIEFLITGQGNVTPRLIGSSGNEELDAIALQTVRKWQFRPAEKDHKPIDSKIRLRIVFEVH